jgi:hypothetical protein
VQRGRVNPETPDQISGPAAPPRSGTGRRLAVAGIGAAVLAVGGVAVAQAATSGAPTPSGSSSVPAPPGTSGVPDRGPREHRPHLAGTVVSASGGTITITDREGFQRTIHTTPATTYADGLTATPAAGTEIVAEGTVDTDKTSLKATRIAKRPDRPGRGRGFPGGGPGRHGHGPGDRPGGPPAPGTPGPGTPSPGSPSPGSPSPGETSPTPAPTS